MSDELHLLLDCILSYICDTEECLCDGGEDSCVLCDAQHAQELLEKEK